MSAKQRHDSDDISEVRDNLDKDLKPSRQESLNEYYTRKQRTTASVLTPDGEQELVDSDDSFSESRNYPNADAGPMNTPWTKDRYGR